MTQLRNVTVRVCLWAVWLERFIYNHYVKPKHHYQQAEGANTPGNLRVRPKVASTMSHKLYTLPLNLARYSLSRNTRTFVWKWKHANYFPSSQMNTPERCPCLSWGFMCPDHSTTHAGTTVSQTKSVLHILAFSGRLTRSQCFLKILEETKHQLTSLSTLVPVQEINFSY